MKTLFIIALQLISLSPLFAQVKEGEVVVGKEHKFVASRQMNDKKSFNQLNVSLSAGSTGFGIDLETPISQFVHLRAGFDVMPKFDNVINFGVHVGEKEPGQTDKEYDEISKSKFEKLSAFLVSFTGQQVEDNIDMICSPSFYNFKFLVDVYPFAKASTESNFLKNLYLTAGFYWGNSNIANARNTTEAMATLFSVNMYNGMYEKFSTDYYYYNDFFPGMGLDPDVIDLLSEKFLAWGRMGLHKGEFVRDIYNEAGEKIHSKGTPYMIEPNEESMVKAKVIANNFKPYFGFGSELSKFKSGWKMSFDVGALFWGGSPSVITHDGTDLVYDVENVSGKVGRYVRMIKKFKVYPVIDIRFTKRLF